MHLLVRGQVALQQQQQACSPPPPPASAQPAAWSLLRRHSATLAAMLGRKRPQRQRLPLHSTSRLPLTAKGPARFTRPHLLAPVPPQADRPASAEAWGKTSPQRRLASRRRCAGCPRGSDLAALRGACFRSGKGSGIGFQGVPVSLLGTASPANCLPRQQWPPCQVKRPSCSRPSCRSAGSTVRIAHRGGSMRPGGVHANNEVGTSILLAPATAASLPRPRCSAAAGSFAAQWTAPQGLSAGEAARGAVGCILTMRQGTSDRFGPSSGAAGACLRLWASLSRCSRQEHWQMCCAAAAAAPEPLATEPKLSRSLHSKGPSRNLLAEFPSRAPSHSQALCCAGAAAADQSLADHLQRFWGQLARWGGPGNPGSLAIAGKGLPNRLVKFGEASDGVNQLSRPQALHPGHYQLQLIRCSSWQDPQALAGWAAFITKHKARGFQTS